MMTEIEYKSLVNNYNNVLRSINTKLDNLLSNAQKCRNMELENAEIKEPIDDMVEDIIRQVEDLRNETSTLFD